MKKIFLAACLLAISSCVIANLPTTFSDGTSATTSSNYNGGSTTATTQSNNY